jgi:hypothetical protein
MAFLCAFPMALVDRVRSICGFINGTAMRWSIIIQGEDRAREHSNNGRRARVSSQMIPRLAVADRLDIRPQNATPHLSDAARGPRQREDLEPVPVRRPVPENAWSLAGKPSHQASWMTPWLVPRVPATHWQPARQVLLCFPSSDGDEYDEDEAHAAVRSGSSPTLVGLALVTHALRSFATP